MLTFKDGIVKRVSWVVDGVEVVKTENRRIIIIIRVHYFLDIVYRVCYCIL